MVRALPSAIPPKMYRHFALVTVLFTTVIAMFADGENREARATQVEQREEPEVSTAEVAKPVIARRTTHPHRRFSPNISEFDVAFGAPMDRALGSLGAYTTQVAAEVTQAGYSEGYLSSLRAEERDLLLTGLAREGLLSPEERERKSAALIAASHVRSGGSAAHD